MRFLSQSRMWMRAALAAAVAVLPACSMPSSATSGPPGMSTDGVAIAHVDHRYIPAQDFVRISEYFTAAENPSGRLIERTDPAQRAGYYFIVSLAWHPSVELPAGTQLDVDYIRGDEPDTHHAHFVLTQPIGTFHEILLGLTGKDWDSKNLKLTAYKVTIKDAAGKVLADHQSFLWALPAAPQTAAMSATLAPGTVGTEPTPPAKP